MYLTRIELNQDKLVPFATFINKEKGTSIKYKVERDERYLPYIELGRWLCSHFQLETPLNFHKPITQKLYNLEK